VHHPGQAFPSDHSTAAFAIALVALVFLARRWGAALLAGALIGFSRVSVGVHYPGDILGSVLVSVIGVGSVALLHFRLRTGAQPWVTGPFVASSRRMVPGGAVARSEAAAGRPRADL